MLSQMSFLRFVSQRKRNLVRPSYLVRPMSMFQTAKNRAV